MLAPLPPSLATPPPASPAAPEMFPPPAAVTKAPPSPVAEPTPPPSVLVVETQVTRDSPPLDSGLARELDSQRRLVASKDAEIATLKARVEGLLDELEAQRRRTATYVAELQTAKKDNDKLARENVRLRGELASGGPPKPVPVALVVPPSQPQQVELSPRPLSPVPATSLLVFPLNEIIRATGNFSVSTKIGEGGFADVYKAKVNQTWVAVKRLHTGPSIGVETLLAEIEALSRYHHPHLIQLLGHTDLAEPRPCLIYPFMPRGSLRDRLSCKDGTAPLTWNQRVKIAFQSAQGILYLHKPHSQADVMVHLDVKTANILLTDDMEAKVADFGLVRSLGHSHTHVTKSLFGTKGYLAPEFIELGVITEKTDVYGFGVVLAEIMTAKHAVYRVPGGRPTELASKFLQLVPLPTAAETFSPLIIDPAVQKAWPLDSARSFAQIARHCLEPDPANRVDMGSVTQRLKMVMETELDLCRMCSKEVNKPGSNAIVRFPCGHSLVCTACVTILREKNLPCPLCRAPIPPF